MAETLNYHIIKPNQTEDNITKTYLYDFDPLKPHFYIVKLGFTEVDFIFSYFCFNT